MKYFDLEDYVKNLNSFFNDEELNKLHEQLRYPISNMTTKEKFNDGLTRVREIQVRYNARVVELISSKFDLQVRDLEDTLKLL